MNEETPDQKFSIDGPFREPVLRCDACQALVLVAELKKLGMCPECSNVRVRNVRTMREDDMDKARKWATEGKIDSDWLKLFEAVDLQ